jgi:hypothetical protein
MGSAVIEGGKGFISRMEGGGGKDEGGLWGLRGDGSGSAGLVRELKRAHKTHRGGCCCFADVPKSR